MIALWIGIGIVIGLGIGLLIKGAPKHAFGYNPEPKGGVHPPATPPPGPPRKRYEADVICDLLSKLEFNEPITASGAGK